VINSNLGPIFHRFRDAATYSLKLFIKNCGQIAADKHMVIIIGSRQRLIRWYHCRPPTTYDWHTI